MVLLFPDGLSSHPFKFGDGSFPVKLLFHGQLDKQAPISGGKFLQSPN